MVGKKQSTRKQWPAGRPILQAKGARMRGLNGIVSSVAIIIVANATFCAAAHPRPAVQPGRNIGRPSVLLITLDTVRADHVGCYGYSAVQTPNIDRLATEGVRFANAYTQVPITLPSHAVILTGTYPMFNGVRDFTSTGLRSDIPTLSEVFHHNGYHTAAFVSSFVLNSMWGLNRGFDVYDDEMGPGVGHSNQLFLVQRRGDRTVDQMLDWLGRNGREPFFVWLHLYDAHSPYHSPNPYRSRYPGHPYDGAIAFDDSQVGRVFARLRQMAIYDDALIVLTSDHGESLGEHGESEHGFFIYNSTLRVPLVLKLPGRSMTTSVISQPVSTLDIATTIAQVCGIPPAESAGFRGQSLLRKPSPSGDANSSFPGEAVYAESYYPRNSFGWHELRAVVTADYEYVEAPQPELYDLHKDLGERSNITSTHPAIASFLRERLAEIVGKFTSHEKPPSRAPHDPDTIEKLRSLGYVAYQGSDSGDAGGGQTADPKDKIATLNQILHAADLTHLGNYQQADQALDQLAREEPSLYVVHFQKGENYLAWGNPQAAVDEFRKTLFSNPNFDQAALGLGRADSLLGRDNEAAVSFELALRLNGRNFLARVALAKVCWRQHLFERARSELAPVVEDHPQFAEGHADYGVTLAELRKYKEALAELQRGIDLGFRDAMTYNYLGIAYANTGDPARAIQAYETAIKFNPEYAAAYLNMAIQYARQHQQAKAQLSYRKVCKLSSPLCKQYASFFSSPAQQ